jgi:hypothetical protein
VFLDLLVIAAAINAAITASVGISTSPSRIPQPPIMNDALVNKCPTSVATLANRTVTKSKSRSDVNNAMYASIAIQ